MRRAYRQIIRIMVLVVVFGAAPVRAQESTALQSCVLVLPLQASREAAGETVALGWAVHTVLEHMLALHSDLEECWVTWFLPQLFPRQEELHAWLHGQGEVPAAVAMLRFRYLLTGQVHPQGDTLQVTLTLRDRTTDHSWSATLPVDLPGLVTWRQGVLHLLVQAGLPAPEAQQPKMLWTEDLSLAALTLLGQGMPVFVSAMRYDTEHAAYNPQPFIEALQLAPNSYLLLNNAGIVLRMLWHDPAEVAAWSAATGQAPDVLEATLDLVTAYKQAARFAVGQQLLEDALSSIVPTAKERHALRLALADLHVAWAESLEQRAVYVGEAITHYEQALALARAEGNQEKEGTVLYNLGKVYWAMGQLEQAIAYYEQELVLVRAVGNRVGEAIRLRNLGGVYDAMSRYDRAIEYHEQALAILREEGIRVGEDATLHNLGVAYAALSQYDRAIEYYEQSLAIGREVGNREGEGLTFNRLGLAYHAMSQYSRAIAYFEQALAIGREVGDRAGEGATLHNLMQLWQARKLPTLAIFYGKQAVNVYQAIRGDIQTLDRTLQRSFLTSKEETYRTLAELLITEGRLPEAQQVLDMLKEEEFVDFVRRDANAIQALQGQATLTPGEAAQAERYRALADRVTALGKERGTLRAKAAKTALTAEETQRLETLTADLSVAAQAFQQFLDALEAAFRSTAAAPDPLFHLREA